jgi:carbon monoxide dehydrogenase subunit G
MTTSTTSRSIEIDAPVGNVFTFVSDLEKFMGCVPSIRRVVVDRVDTAENVATASYAWTTTLGVGPLTHEAHGTTTREQCVPDHRVVYRHAMGLRTVETLTMEPASTGTRLDFTVSVTSPVPLLDKLGVPVASRGRGHAHYLDLVVGEVKRQVEAGSGNRSAGPVPDP